MKGFEIGCERFIHSLWVQCHPVRGRYKANTYDEDVILYPALSQPEESNVVGCGLKPKTSRT